MFSKIINWLDPKKAKVLYVIDGDTLVVASSFMNSKTTKIRLARVNAPEIPNLRYGKTRLEKGGLEAKAWLEKLEDTYITFTSDNQPVSYDRVVAWVFDQNAVDVSQKMTSLGLVKVYTGLKKDQLQTDLEALELQAKKQNLGNWKGGIWQR